LSSDAAIFLKKAGPYIFFIRFAVLLCHSSSHEKFSVAVFSRASLYFFFFIFLGLP
jgi:hypothetical protein